jgi:hypothetical protein
MISAHWCLLGVLMMYLPEPLIVCKDQHFTEHYSDISSRVAKRAALESASAMNGKDEGTVDEEPSKQSCEKY